MGGNPPIVRLVPEPTLFVTDASGTFAHVRERLLKLPNLDGC